MPLERTEYLLLAAFIVGWIVAKVSAWIGRRLSTTERDPRDDRIRSLTADVRVAQTQTEKVRAHLEAKDKELTETQKLLKERDELIAGHKERIERLKKELKESVQKTNELRAELTERATEQTRSEALLREVQTELSVARASTDLLASGVLRYPDTEEEDQPVFTAGRP
jgi:peptidoglycan hydrolase CwlO-like protein